MYNLLKSVPHSFKLNTMTSRFQAITCTSLPHIRVKYSIVVYQDSRSYLFPPWKQHVIICTTGSQYLPYLSISSITALFLLLALIYITHYTIHYILWSQSDITHPSQPIQAWKIMLKTIKYKFKYTQRNQDGTSWLITTRMTAVAFTGLAMPVRFIILCSKMHDTWSAWTSVYMTVH